MLEKASASRKYGVAIVANDKIVDWLLPFLESYRATNVASDLVYPIPYDENVTRTRRAAEVYGVDLGRGRRDGRTRQPGAPALPFMSLPIVAGACASCSLWPCRWTG